MSSPPPPPSTASLPPASVSSSPLPSPDPFVDYTAQRSNSLPSMSLDPSLPSPSLLPSSSDDSALVLSSFPLASSSSSVPLSQQQHQRQLARNALLLVHSKASSLRASSSVVRFSMDTVSRLVPGSARAFTARRWNTYGEPMLRRIDERLDDAVNAIANATSGLQHVYAYNAHGAAAEQQQLHHDERMEQEDDEHERKEQAPPHTRSSLPPSSFSSPAVPLLSTDASLQQQLVAVPPSSAAVSSVSSLYWDRLKSKFVSSHWYTRVDHILMQNSVVLAFTHHLLHPAEVFLQTVTEEFLSHQSQDDFLLALKARVGPAWDDRLAPLAKGFYTTAKAVSAVVGAGRFVGGVMQLGKTRVDEVMEDLLKQWDRVLGLGDDMMERWLPERVESVERRRLEPGRDEKDGDDGGHKPQLQPPQVSSRGAWVHRERQVDFEDDDEGALSSSSSESSPDSPPFEPLDSGGPRLRRSSKKRSSEHLHRYGEEEEEEEDGGPLAGDAAEDDLLLSPTSPLSSSLTLSPLYAHPDRSTQVLITKFGKRLRQRIPSIPSSSSLLSSFTVDLRQRLTDSSWFTLVDEILMQNALVKALAAFVRPAEHLFTTALNLFTSGRENVRRLEAPAVEAPLDAVDEGEEDDGRSSSTGMVLKADAEPNAARTASPAESSTSPSQFAFVAPSPISSSVPDVPALDASPARPSAAPRPVAPSAASAFAPRVVAPSPSSFVLSSPSPASLSPSSSLPSSDPVVDDFVFNLRERLGGSWDDRLFQPARSFYHTAQSTWQMAPPIRPKPSA